MTFFHKFTAHNVSIRSEATIFGQIDMHAMTPNTTDDYNTIVTSDSDVQDDD